MFTRRTPESERSNLFEKYIQFAFDNQEGEMDKYLNCTITAWSIVDFLTGAVEMTETEVKKKISSSTQAALNVVTAERFVGKCFIAYFRMELVNVPRNRIFKPLLL